MQNKKEHRAESLQMITRWQQSGLTQKAFCITNNIAYHVFHYWYGVYRSSQNTSGSFLPVTVTTTGRPEPVTLIGVNGIQVQLAFSDQSIRFVKQLLLS
jgi:hypothetical protein